MLEIILFVLVSALVFLVLVGIVEAIRKLGVIQNKIDALMIKLIDLK